MHTSELEKDIADRHDLIAEQSVNRFPWSHSSADAVLERQLLSGTKIKWGSVTKLMRDRPVHWGTGQRSAHPDDA